MDHLKQYIAEEIAENHADGQLTRREAMRQLAVLGFGAMSASALLAACGGGDDDPDGAAGQPATTAGGTATTAAGGPVTTGPAVATEDITYPGRGITVRGVFAPAATPRGAVLVIHENSGITEFVRTFTGRLAGSGYTALAVDLLSAQGGTGAFTDIAQLRSTLTDNATNRSVDDMKSSLEELQRRAPGQKLGAVGFCFGGAMVWELVKAGDPPPLAAAAPFYGTIATPDFSKTRAAIFAVYAANDSRVNDNRDSTVLPVLRATNLTQEVKTYPGVGHAFMNHTGNNYNEAQAAAAYQDLMSWFGRHLG